MTDDTLERTKGTSGGTDGTDGTDGSDGSGGSGGTDGSGGSGGSNRTVVMDPRMRQRREEVRKERGRRRRHRSLWVVLPVLGLAGLLLLAHTPLLDVDRIDVAGAQRTSMEDVVAASRLGRGQPLLTLDEGAAERRIRALPWVDDAQVTRRWPGAVRVTVTERTAVAAVATEDPATVAWVDETGRVLQVGGTVAEGVVSIMGMEVVPAVGERLPAEARDAVAVAAGAPDRVPGVLASISVDLEGILAEGIPGAGAVVDFHDGEAVDEKLVALDTVLTNVDMTCAVTIDLQVPDNPAVTRQPGCG